MGHGGELAERKIEQPDPNIKNVQTRSKLARISKLLTQPDAALHVENAKGADIVLTI